MNFDDFEADFDGFLQKSVTASMIRTESSRHEQARKKNGEEEEEELKKKKKKLKSVKLSRSPSLNSPRRKSKSQPSFNILPSSSSSSASWSSNQSSPTSALDSVSSPNYMKSTSSSDARKDNFQKLAEKSNERSSSKSVKCSKFKNETEMKRYSSRISDLASSNGKSSSPGQKLGFVLQRKPSLKPVRKLTFKSKVSSMEKHLDKSTCSSTMKDSKFPSYVHLEHGEDESEKFASMKICPYSYCFFQGHRHSNGAPIKRLVSMRRRVLKTQMSKKLECQAGARSNHKKEDDKRTAMEAIEGLERETCKHSSAIVGKEENELSVDLKEEEEQVPENSNSDEGEEKTAIKLEQETFEENKISSMAGSKSNKWSNLKKIILLKRFIKALEKAKNINPKEPSYLSMEVEPEAEKVHLKHKTQGKKNTEEWFLDFALRQFITKLEPAQKRRVTLLVEAFESVTPADSMDFPRTGKYKNRDGVSFGRISDIKKKFNQEQANEVIQRKKNLNLNLNLDDSETTYREIPVNGKVLKVGKEIISRLSIQLDGGDSGSAGTDMESSTLMGPTMGKNGEDREEFKVAGDFGSLKKIEQVEDNDFTNEIKIDKRKNTGLWFLIYNHMVSTIDENGETEPLVEGIVQTEIAGTSPEIESSAAPKVDENGIDQTVELHSMEAIRVVEEAIDQILLPGSIGADPELEKQSDGIGVEKSSRIISQGMKNWKTLRRMMIVKRFIKAVEKVKKFNRREQGFRAGTEEEEDEKVKLRNQNTEERKNGEEWMLDYALQQAVAKLTPARKRKVALLVEAFETVGPNLGR